MRLPDWSSTSMLVRGTSTVRPSASGLGCETWGVSVIRTVRLPCATATRLILTFSPMTMMPERSSIRILATVSGSIGSCSISVSSWATRPP